MTIEEKVERLERQALYMKIGGGVLLVLVFLLMARAAREPRNIEVRSLTVRDAERRERIWLGVDQDGFPRVELSDETGVRTLLAVVGDGPEFTLRDNADRRRVTLLVGPDNAPGIHVFDTAGRARGMLVVRPDDTAALLLLDKAETRRVRIHEAPDGPRMELRDHAGELIFEVPR